MAATTRARTRSDARSRPSKLTPSARRARAHFLDYFPDGFRDEVYVETERAYKWNAHRDWTTELDRATFGALLEQEAHDEIAARAVRIESRTNLLFSFEKMALRDALRAPSGARTFAIGLYDWLYGKGSEHDRFERWCGVVATLPRRQTRVLTWPVVTIFGFIARPRVHLFLKPNVTRARGRGVRHGLRLPVDAELGDLLGGPRLRPPDPG